MRIQESLGLYGRCRPLRIHCFIRGRILQEEIIPTCYVARVPVDNFCNRTVDADVLACVNEVTTKAIAAEIMCYLRL